MELTDSSQSDIEFAIFSALEETITANVNAEIASKTKTGSPLPFPKEVLINRIIQKNIDQLEENLYMTLGHDGKVYLAGDWLMRPFLHDGKLIPTIDYLKEHVDTTNVVFLPEKTGKEVRAELWKD